MKYDRWTRGTIRSPILNFKIGDRVVVVRSTFKHRAAGIGATFWVMGVDSQHIMQASEYAFGQNVYKLVASGEEVAASKQTDVANRARGLLARSAYAPKNQARMTYFHTSPTSIPKGFRYDDSNQTGS